MGYRDVTNQAELNAAVAAGDVPVISDDATYDISRAPRVVAYGSSQPRVEAYGSSQPRVVAHDSSQPRVEAYGSSQLQARGPVKVTSRARHAVVTHSRDADVSGIGAHVELPDATGAGAWCEFYGIEPDADGTVVLFKRVEDDLRSARGMAYPVGERVEALDFDATPRCGGGLHLSPRPALTLRYAQGPRLLAVRVALADVVPIPDPAQDVPDKCKVPACVVLYECDEDGEPLGARPEGVTQP